MTVYVHVVGETPIRLWGLSSRERLRRQLPEREDVRWVTDLEVVPSTAAVLLLRGDYLFDSRILDALLAAENTLLRVESAGNMQLVAARVPAPLAAGLRAGLVAQGDAGSLPAGLVATTPDRLCSAYQERLLKADAPFVLPVTADDRQRLETLLFGAAYKGITDLVTKWIWPLPARWGVHLCVRLGLRPNHVTTLNWVLAFAAGWLFWNGNFGWGLLLGWFMTYLDTVDGKLARVTVSSSPIGHLLDHLLDIVHPPFWYLAWGAGLAAYRPLLLPGGVELAIWTVFVGYIVGRLVEGGFQLWLGRFGIFAWRKIDSFSRLITARRNPCLILLTAGVLAGRPDLGLEAVALWTLLSSLFLLLRLLMAGYSRAVSGPLIPWLAVVGRDAADRSLAVRWFARGARAAASNRAG